jgi:2-dehydro-3-deoxyphosphogluconate aldolase/(4S)-4-hydroxy-2-oxoglutarate aldolase
MRKQSKGHMGKAELVETLREVGIIASVRLPNEQLLLRGIAALVEGGIRAVELSYDTNGSFGWLIRKLKEKELALGVGAITHSTQAREAGAFGADFVTSSVTTPDVVAACDEMEVPCILSSLTPTEVWRAHEMGADFVKVIAIEALGGTPYIRFLRQSLPTSHLVGAEMPLDGSCLSYLEAGIEVLEFKSSLALPELAEQGQWDEISQRVAEIVKTRDNWRANHK